MIKAENCKMGNCGKCPNCIGFRNLGNNPSTPTKDNVKDLKNLG